MPPSGPAALLARDRDRARPLLTFYDDASGERTELSATTLANWVAKTANLLQDEFDVGPGSVVAVVLPPHWQTAAVLLGVWSCGAAVLDTAAEHDGELAAADVVLSTQDRLPELAEVDLPDDVLGLSLHPLGLGMPGYTGPARDFALEVRTHGDVFVPLVPPDPAAPGLLLGELTLSLAGLVESAEQLAGLLGIAPGDRIMVDEETAAEAGPVTWLLAPLAAGASIVLCRRPEGGALVRRAETERVTATLGLRIDGVRQLGRPA
ncbi:TIGR03089 family protein [Blastococcus sp. TF02A-30]|uniref:TIGR03089 family protein n=1 Tax=Blastococcus sp. TF02A-30 TaxID=2250580 RepID=UPI000DEA9E46|nr:TIGR03089 family protein [Blastococcus sp. TF02A-30]RBY86580.1 TIGR03089 family protein [Blastococcus sp. TF02A-30]